MKRGKLFFGMLFIILLFACHSIHYLNPIRWFTPDVTVTWDPPMNWENGDPIKPEDRLWYSVYIDKDSYDTHEDAEMLTKEPIKETNFIISASELADTEQKGRYFIGVQAVVYDKDGHARKSKIAWSDSTAATKNNPFGIRID